MMGRLVHSNRSGDEFYDSEVESRQVMTAGGYRGCRREAR